MNEDSRPRFVIFVEVSISPTVYASFFVRKFRAKLFCTYILSLNFLALEYWQKCNHKMLVILTRGRWGHSFSAALFLLSKVLWKIKGKEEEEDKERALALQTMYPWYMQIGITFGLSIVNCLRYRSPSTLHRF
jgi:hypothetical protein